MRKTRLAQLPQARAVPAAPEPDQCPALLLTAFLQAQVVLSFQAYPAARCVLLEVQVRAALAQPGQSVVCEIIIVAVAIF